MQILAVWLLTEPALQEMVPNLENYLYLFAELALYGAELNRFIL